MTACAKCGFDPHAEVLHSWSMFIGRQPESLNAHTVNAGASRWKYAKDRDAWCLLIRAERLMHRIPKATTKRRVTFRRYYGGRMKERDHANYVGGLKPVVDALVREGMLVDDSPAHLEDHYEQAKSAHTWGISILIEEVAHAG